VGNEDGNVDAENPLRHCCAHRAEDHSAVDHSRVGRRARARKTLEKRPHRVLIVHDSVAEITVAPLGIRDAIVSCVDSDVKARCLGLYQPQQVARRLHEDVLLTAVHLIKGTGESCRATGQGNGGDRGEDGDTR
jgi:hypothetical protein